MTTTASVTTTGTSRASLPSISDASTVTVQTTGVVAGYRRGRRRTPIVTTEPLAAHRGELTAVIGPNGSGKTTLLRTLVGFLDPLDGAIDVDGRRLHDVDRRTRAQLLAVVLTDRVDTGLLHVGEVIELGRQPHTGWGGALDDHDRDIARRAAEQVGIAHRWDAQFDELSDGQRQRALIARALAQEPSVLVLDEPTAFLDLPGRVELTSMLARLAHNDGLSVVVSSHDLELILGVADQAWVVANGTAACDPVSELIDSERLAGAFPTVAIKADPTTGHITAREHQDPHP